MFETPLVVSDDMVELRTILILLLLPTSFKPLNGRLQISGVKSLWTWFLSLEMGRNVRV